MNYRLSPRERLEPYVSRKIYSKRVAVISIEWDLCLRVSGTQWDSLPDPSDLEEPFFYVPMDEDENILYPEWLTELIETNIKAEEEGERAVAENKRLGLD